MKRNSNIRLTLTMMLVALGAFLLAACDSGGGGAATAIPAAPTAVPTAIPAQSNADLLKAAAANMKAAKSYHMELEANQGGQDVKMSGDIDVTNNKSKLAMTAMGQSVNVISIGSDTFLSMDGGTTYTKSPTGGDMGLDSFTKMWDSFKAEDIDKSKDAIKDGTPKEETVGSDATRHMTASSKDLGSLSATGGATEGTIDMWVTTGSKPTVRKMQIASSGDAAVSATIEWTKVDEAVTIDAPATP